MARKVAKGAGRAGKQNEPQAIKAAKVDKQESKTGGNADLLDMDEAIAMLQTSRPSFYRWLKAGQIKGMKAGSQWRFERAEIERFLRGDVARVGLSEARELEQATAGFRKNAPKAGESAEADGDPLMKLFSAIIQSAVEMNASDIHIEPTSENIKVRFRIDGAMMAMTPIPSALAAPFIGQWKAMAAMNVNEKTRSQDGRILLNVHGKALDLRISVVPALNGESIVARILTKERLQQNLDNIALAPRNRERLERALAARHGQIIFTGPTGCGKTTLAYACMAKLNKPEVKIVTVEDPVEISLDWATQVPIRNSNGITFACALRCLLRQAPDIIYVGETGDQDTAQLCANAALTGHLVLTQLHTNSAAATLIRLADMGVLPFVLGDSVRLVVGQRLVRHLCPKCAKASPITADERAKIERVMKGSGFIPPSIPTELHHPVGCSECKMMGYRGRRLITEMLEMTPEISSALARKASAEEIQAIAVSQGMVTLAGDGLRLVLEGQTTLDEVCGTLAI